MKDSFVYILCDSASNLYKIGVSRGDPHKRIAQLQTGNGNEIHLVSFYETGLAFKMEKHLHFIYGSKREQGEWFRLDNDDVLNFKENCRKYEKMVIALKDNPFFR